MSTPTLAVIYHRADFDGIFSREIAKRHFGDLAEYIGWDYNDPLPVIRPEVNRIYMIDISVGGMMDDPRVVWIDHHKSAMEKHGPNMAGYRIDGVAACRLAWQWFNNPCSPENPHLHPCDYALPDNDDYVHRRVTEPLAVRLAGEYDIWDKRDPNAESFQHGLRSCEVDFQRLLSYGADASAYVLQLLDGGKVLQYARCKENESIIKAQGFDVQFEGLRFLACNAARYNSHLFTAGLRPEHDGCLGFNFDGRGAWRVSLYGVPGKSEIDLSVIATKYGGGGHRQACGFSCAPLPFELPLPTRRSEP